MTRLTETPDLLEELRRLRERVAALEAGAGGSGGVVTLNLASGDPKIIIQIGGTAKFAIGLDDSDGDALQIVAGDAMGTTVRMAIDGSGNVGLGATTPKQLVDIGTAYGHLTFGGSGPNVGANAYYASGWKYLGAGYADVVSIGDNVAGDFVVYTAPSGASAGAALTLTQRLKVANGGTVTVGTGASGNGDLYIGNNCSALSFTDRTPGHRGDALAEVAAIKNDAAGNIDHSSLPASARRTITTSKGETEPGRDLGAMVSLLVAAVQALIKRVDSLAEAKR